VKLSILTQYYPPEVGAPQNRLSNLALHFVSHGHHVTVLTAMPNYPAGKIQSGYGGLLRQEWQGAVRVIRTFIYPSQSAALIPRLLSYVSFVLSSMMFGTFLMKSSDYLLVESPPLFLGMAAVWLGRLKQAKVIFNVSDLWPESAVRLGLIRRESIAHRVTLRLESFLYRHAWLVTGQSKSILEDIELRFPNRHTFLLSNGADTCVFQPHGRTEKARARLTRDDEFVVLYAGLHGLAQGLEQVLAAAEELVHDGGYRFVFIGDGPHKQKLILKAAQDSIGNVTFLDAVPIAQMPQLLAAADLIVVPLGMHIPGAVPSKLYEAMASGRPIVLVASGEAADVVLRFRAGIAVTPGQVPALVQAIRTMRVDQGLAMELAGNARHAAVEHFDRTKIAASFIRYLESRSNERNQAKTEEHCEASTHV
jgi:colanic acid biosynthesis glycosyl transferase WcaI